MTIKFIRQDYYNGRFYAVNSVLTLSDKEAMVYVKKGSAIVYSAPVTPEKTSTSALANLHARLHSLFSTGDHQFTGGTEITPADTDKVPIIDTVLKFLTWANLKSLLKTYILYNGATSFWVDIDFPVIIRTTGVGVPALAVFQGNLKAPQWAVNDYYDAEDQEFIHGWKQASMVTWHVHVWTGGTNVDNRYLNFEIEFTGAPFDGTAFPNIVQPSGDLLIPANTPAVTHKIYNITTWTPTGFTIGSHVKARLKRIASTGTAPTANPFIGKFQMHVECDTPGSRQISAK